MIRTAPCFRHGPAHWIAACADCTAWHLSAQRAVRPAPRSLRAGASPARRPMAVSGRGA